MHEGAYSFSHEVPLKPNFTLTNEPGYCAYLLLRFVFFFGADGLIDVAGKWGIRIESALVVRRVRVGVFISGYVVILTRLYRPSTSSMDLSGCRLSG